MIATCRPFCHTTAMNRFHATNQRTRTCGDTAICSSFTGTTAHAEVAQGVSAGVEWESSLSTVVLEVSSRQDEAPAGQSFFIVRPPSTAIVVPVT